MSPLERFRSAGYVAHPLPVTSVSHRINAARTVIKLCRFNESACHKGLQALREWQYKYDEERRTFSKDPDHNWASHGADSFSYGALAMYPRQVPLPVEKPVQPIARPWNESLRLDDLWDTAPSATKMRV